MGHVLAWIVLLALLCGVKGQNRVELDGTSTGTAGSVAAQARAAWKSVAQDIDDLCTGVQSVRFAAQASAKAVAEAFARASASTVVRATSNFEGGEACGVGDVSATAVAPAYAKSFATAIADAASCCPSAQVISNATVEAVEVKFATAYARAVARACVEGTGESESEAEVLADEVVNATAITFALVYAQIEKCSTGNVTELCEYEIQPEDTIYDITALTGLDELALSEMNPDVNLTSLETSVGTVLDLCTIVLNATGTGDANALLEDSTARKRRFW